MAELLKLPAPVLLPTLDGWSHPNYPLGTAPGRYHPGTLVACKGGKCVGRHGAGAATHALPLPAGAGAGCGSLLSQPWD